MGNARGLQSWLVLGGFVLLVFCTGTAEYLVAGVVSHIADDLGVSVAAAGQTVTVYALGVALGGPVMTVLTARLPRKGLALGLSALFLTGVLITAVSPGFTGVLLGRAVSSLSQATLFAIGLVTATDILGDKRSGMAIAIVSSGLTVATVLGVPLGVLLGGGLSWRWPFLILAGITLVGMGMLAGAMPRACAPDSHASDEIRSLLRLPVLLAIGTTVVGFAGVATVFTYLVPLLTDVTGLASTAVPWLLLAYGVGGFAGNLAAGRLTDMSLRATLLATLCLLAVVLGLFPVVALTTAPTVILVLLLGVLSTATVPPLQALVLQHAGAAPSLSLAVNVGAFNLANAMGAVVGGIGVSTNLLRFNGVAGAIFAAMGVGMVALVMRRPNRGDGVDVVVDAEGERNDAGDYPGSGV